MGQDANQDAGDQRPDHGAETDTLDVHAADEGPEQDAQEQAQGRKVVEECREPLQWLTRSALTVTAPR